MANTAASVLKIARGEIGYSRWNDSKTGTKYGRWYADLVGSAYFAANGVPFCAMFVSWVFNQAGASCAGVPGAYCPTMLQAAKTAGKAISNVRNAQPGDIVYFDWDGGVVDHVGIIEVNNGSYVTTIEGNTDNGQVKRKTRSWSYIKGIVRPNYNTATKPVSSTTSSSTSSSTSSKPTTTTSSNYTKLDVDGKWGKATTKRLQQYLKTSVDGIVSQQYSMYKAKNPGLLSASWQWVNKPRGGSDMVKALQKKVGSTVDGFIGPNTIKALQKKLGTTVDGHISNPSECVKALQKALNNNKF